MCAFACCRRWGEREEKGFVVCEEVLCCRNNMLQRDAVRFFISVETPYLFLCFGQEMGGSETSTLVVDYMEDFVSLFNLLEHMEE